MPQSTVSAARHHLKKVEFRKQRRSKMNYSPADEYDRRQGAREAEHRCRIAAVVWDPNGPEIQIASEVVGRQLEAEATVAAAARAEAYAVMCAECDAKIAARRVQEGWV
jgi:hypothetical protein